LGVGLGVASPVDPPLPQSNLTIHANKIKWIAR
jgi:hypothetical protein